MATSEQQNLEELYRNMLDGELEALAAEAYALTDVARPLLRAEIARRGLDFALRESAAPAKPKAVPLASGEALVVMGKVWDLIEARRVKGILDRIDVPSFFGPDNLQEFDEAAENFDEAEYPQGFDFKVKELHAPAAVVALSMAPPMESVALPEEDFTMKCPQCGSQEVILESLDENEAEPDAKFTWICDACGHEWKNDGLGA